MAELAIGLQRQVRSVVEIGKPKVVMLIVFTAYVGMLLAYPATIDWPVVLAGCVGIGLVAAAGAAVNHVVDARIDRLMARTSARPLASDLMESRFALAWATLWGVGGTAILLAWVNALTAVLTLIAMLGYAIVYTVFLKHRTPQNIVWGGAAGAAPPLLGWAAATGEVGIEGLLLFLIIFLWTPPHFWPLAIAKVEEYRRASVPMLPVTHGIQATKYQILLYTIAMVAVTVVPWLIGMSGWLYGLAALGLGGEYLRRSWRLYRSPRHAGAMSLFGYSIIYLALLFLALLLDHYLL
ncbi:heme o synthase [Guyparkeria sp.]|uniref:heme o synthase n=1 Tax=Guyparkeria sp. TaxID=2035736 RepID=UPI003970ED1C